MTKCSFTLVAAMTAAISTTTLAELNFQPDNILVTTGNQVMEITPFGSVVSEIELPMNPDGGGARDLSILEDGRLAVFNGSLNPFLSIFDGTTWTHNQIPGWNTNTDPGTGGVTSIDDYVYLSDASGGTQGIQRFDLISETSQSFGVRGPLIDVSLGQDGLLYGILQSHEDGIVIDPNTMEVQSEFRFRERMYGVIADENSFLYGINAYGELQKFDRFGDEIRTTPVSNNLIDIDIDFNGRIIMSDRYGRIFLTDTSMNQIIPITVGTGPAFVAFVTPLNVDLIAPPPVLLGSHVKRGKNIETTLNWNTQADAVDVYLNGAIIETFNGTTATYAYPRKQSQVFTVCNAGTGDCSAQYVSN